MIDIEKVRELTLQALKDEGAFLVDLKLGSDNKISILADHPDGINLEKLERISRGVEVHFDREEEDFSIDVSSPGLGNPFLVEEQYFANVGRPVKVTLHNGNVIKADLAGFAEGKLTLTWKERVPKEIGKGKMVVKREEQFDLEEIKDTRLEIRF